ncbi:hypothetical protein LG651_09940 [Tamlana sp. 62-3]|uniref:Gamma-glutamylcyclotransferase AIG2-like domain-containing protein n=1 Tax=Neotamlana sargassicola TaxID=2883125 RepID=A0A9X1I763_9FLAO|nr:hypothetical protein [Tamlana sargassicola]MCB4808573.1 hypothetical protein [Tamlana sargassicola]
MNDLIIYPWEKFLEESKGFNLFGYGSLINQYSSQETISNSTQLQPVMGFGIKRVLNYDPDENVRSRSIYHDPERGDEYFGVFNLEYTGNIQDKANGVLRKVETGDFENFVKREVGYSLVKIRCQDFYNSSSPFTDAYALVAPQKFNGRQLVNNELLPNVPYYKLCRDGSRYVSEKFLEVWLDTSFLGNGKNVRDWEKEEGLIF